MSNDTAPADEFEDLLLGSSSDPKPPRGKRRGVAAILVVILLGILVLSLGWALSRPAPAAEPAAAQDARLPGEAEVPAEPAPEPTTLTATDPSSRDWPVPASVNHGPKRWSRTQASGFSRTNHGAALAAANITARLDPYRGPTIFRPAFTQQTVGHTRTILAATEDHYRAVVELLGLRTGQPIPPSATSPWVAAVGWQATGCRNACVVRLLTPLQDKHLQFEVPVVWHDGDWRVRLPSPTRAFQPPTDVDPTGYIPFQK
jgi:hypothetical protein